jgi:hypothetical protein
LPLFRIAKTLNFPQKPDIIACISHKTRLQNILRAPGIDAIEKALLKQRFSNLATAQSGYIEKQKKVIFKYMTKDIRTEPVLFQIH